jgi:hypothetical protein
MTAVACSVLRLALPSIGLQQQQHQQQEAFELLQISNMDSAVRWLAGAAQAGLRLPAAAPAAPAGQNGSSVNALATSQICLLAVVMIDRNHKQAANSCQSNSVLVLTRTPQLGS